MAHMSENQKLRKSLVSLKFIITHLLFDFIQVEMGPFKHEVDDGLDLRKAAFECMYTLLDTCVDRLDIFEFLSHVQDGLKDHYDIKVRFFNLESLSMIY
jgi:hypothetical protein